CGQTEIGHQDLPRVLPQMGRSGPRRDAERLRHERAARIGHVPADLRVLDVAPEPALPIMSDVVVLLGRADQPPGDPVRLRAVEHLLALASGDQAADPVAHGSALAIVGDPHGLVAILRVCQLAGHALLLHPLDQPRSPNVRFTAITYMPPAVGNSRSGCRRVAACMPVCRWRVAPLYSHSGTAASVPIEQASWIDTSMYWPCPVVMRSNKARVI